MDIREKLKEVILNTNKEKLDNCDQISKTILGIVSDKTFREEFSEEFLTSVGELLEGYEDEEVYAYFISEVSK